MFGHRILKMYLRHRLTKICILRRISRLRAMQPRNRLIPSRVKKYPLLQSIQAHSGKQTGSDRGKRWSGRRVNLITYLHLLPRSMIWGYTSTPTYSFMIKCLINLYIYNSLDNWGIIWHCISVLPRLFLKRFSTQTVYTVCARINWDTRWRSWLRHCATSRKVAGSIPDSVIEIFHWHKPSGRTMTLGLI